ncbi:hypothetical protein BGZ94_004021 [Podila epigama]|nr:hypothetical protein BGZ94_004021 [Podila epigama]
MSLKRVRSSLFNIPRHSKRSQGQSNSALTSNALVNSEGTNATSSLPIPGSSIVTSSPQQQHQQHQQLQHHSTTTAAVGVAPVAVVAASAAASASAAETRAPTPAPIPSAAAAAAAATASSTSAAPETSEQILLASFKAAALSVTQLYKDSQRHQREEHAKGYEAGLQDILSFISTHPAVLAKQDQGQTEDEIRMGTSLSVDDLVTFSRNAQWRNQHQQQHQHHQQQQQQQQQQYHPDPQTGRNPNHGQGLMQSAQHQQQHQQQFLQQSSQPQPQHHVQYYRPP